jgi:hypothetical protein
MRDSLETEAAQVLLEIENVTGNEAPIARRAPPVSSTPRS